MSVQVPPRMAPKASGIRSFDGSDARALRDAEDDGDEHRRRRRVLHHRGAGRGGEHDERRQLELVAARDAVQAASDEVNHARLDQAARQDKEAGDGDDDVVAEARERLRDVERARQHEPDDEQDGDDVDGNLLGREEHERDKEQDEDGGDGRVIKFSRGLFCYNPATA